MKRAREVFLIFYLFFVGSVYSQVVINEVQSSNSITLKDEFNEYPDWIELFNNSAGTVNLAGWCLSDDKTILNKWSFPAINLLPSEYLVLLASGRDIKQIPLNWYTIIDIGQQWKYLVPGDTVSSNWKLPTYTDTNWPEGKSGFGYSDGDDSTMVSEGTLSIYLRKTFTLLTLTDIDSIYLNVDYDDGFVAYLNGTEVARVNLGTAGTAVAYNQLATPDHEAQMYSGGKAEAFNITSYLGSLVAGENILSVEVHNSSQSSSDLSIAPFLTFGKTSVATASEKPSKYLTFGNKCPHLNFKISSEGESIILSNPLLQVVDSFTPPAMQPDVSYGRLTSDIYHFNYFLIPTPSAPNGNDGLNVFSSDKINYSIPGGYYSTSISLLLSSSASDSIFYTLDGSDPGLSSNRYTTALSISENTVVRSRVIKAGYLPGRIAASTYYFDMSHTIPVVCLSTAPENLWDYNTGIYVLGPNAESWNPYFGANFWMDWEKPFQLEVYDSHGKNIINQGIGVSIFGAWSRANDQKSFALSARKNYGASKIDYPLFAEKDINSFESIVLRNGGNDWPGAMMRDGFITGLTAPLGVEHQAFKPVATYLNGEYWGKYNMREKVNEHFLAENCNVKADDITLLQFNGEVLIGDNTEYQALVSYLNANASLAASDKFNYVANKIDIDDFIKYSLIEIYAHNSDWPGNNIKFWKTSQPNSKWRWILFDTDFGFGGQDAMSYSSNTINFALDPNGPSWPNPPWSTLLFRRLITNSAFRINFINQMADNINTIFESNYVDHYVDSLKNMVDEEMVSHKARWGQSYDSWLYEVDRIKNWAFHRPANMRGFLRSTFELGGQKNISLNVSDASQGKIHLNSITPQKYPFSGIYFAGVPIQMEALPRPGYKFVRWEGTINSTERIISYDPTADGSFTAIFEEAGVQDIQLVINEINYNSSADIATGDWIELYNSGLSTVNLEGFLLTDANPDSGFVFPSGTIMQPDEYLVIASKPGKFKTYNPQVNNCIGEFNYGLSSSGDELRLYNLQQGVVDAVDYLPYSPWPEAADGSGITLELKSPGLDNGQPESWQGIKMGGTPGAKNSMLSGIESPQLTQSLAGALTAFPTKFADYTTISVILPDDLTIKLEIVDMQGNVVQSLANGNYPQGESYFNWIPYENVSNGVYIIRLLTNSTTNTIKVVFIN